MTFTETAPLRRNKGFEETHRELIETAVRLISEKGADALSISALARAAGVNRTTVYYHFENREVLIAAVKTWSSKQLAKAFRPVAPQGERIDYITRFVLDNPELIKMWFEDFISAGDIRDRYPEWDGLVASVAERLAAEGCEADSEVYCVMLLTSAFIGPRVFRNSVRPDEDADTIVRRFRIERQRLLKQTGLLADETI
ncbi:MAG TPA: helix-turn-helix domain-containing protein [Phenylobacterium sp.]|uniref:TetR/AcrR family transcriptional regulator n=1 Tax=Phenylobacterium sp. TaxID=1871053 RepID=UPI002B49061D|nr:helix-turn-helix domain-containing protein [Phenylobacterium sp.]HKR88984.1 helix-turn-helix domain-containing protein [Phenylobacterium sp.]